MRRLDAVLRSSSMSWYPTDTICRFTASRAASRSMLRHRSPVSSPRRMPVVAARKYNGYSSWSAMASRKVRSWYLDFLDAIEKAPAVRTLESLARI